MPDVSGYSATPAALPTMLADVEALWCEEARSCVSDTVSCLDFLCGAGVSWWNSYTCIDTQAALKRHMVRMHPQGRCIQREQDSDPTIY